MILIKISKNIKIVLQMFNIQPTQCFIIGSAILYELNIIQDNNINDIDIVVDFPIWEKLSKKYRVIDVLYGKAIIIERVFQNPWKIEFLDCVGPEKFNYMKKEGIISNGLIFISLENLITYKKLLGRPKDNIHIRLIEKYLKDQKKGGF